MNAPENAPAPAPKVPLFSRGMIAVAAVAALLGAGMAARSMKGDPERQVKFQIDRATRPLVTPDQLAEWGIEGRRDYVLVDLRPDDDFKDGHIRGAVSCGTCHATRDEGKKSDRGETFVDLSKKVVLYTETGTETVKLPKLLAENPRLYLLQGGYDAWKAQVMAPVKFGGETDVAQLEAKKRREAIRAFYAGERPSTGTTAVLPVAPIHRENTHTPVKASEGC